MQTNEPERNRLLAFRRAGDGTLTPAGAYETGGAGDAIPHLSSQGSVVLSGTGRYLLVTNTSSGDLSVFAVGQGGLSLVAAVATGRAPKSAAEHGGLGLCAQHGRAVPGRFRLGGWKVQPLAGSMRELAAGTDPAQVGFSPDGARLVVTQRGTNAIAVYPVLEAGQLSKPLVQPSSGPTPRFRLHQRRRACRDRGFLPRGLRCLHDQVISLTAARRLPTAGLPMPRRAFALADALGRRVPSAGLRRSGGSADSVRGCPCDGPPECPRARTYNGQGRCREC